jgi:hypothetical protein
MSTRDGDHTEPVAQPNKGDDEEEKSVRNVKFRMQANLSKDQICGDRGTDQEEGGKGMFGQIEHDESGKRGKRVRAGSQGGIVARCLGVDQDGEQKEQKATEHDVRKNFAIRLDARQTLDRRQPARASRL